MEQTSALQMEAGGAEFAAAPRKPLRLTPGHAFAILGLAAYVAALALAGPAVVALFPDELSLKLGGHAIFLHNLHGRLISNFALILFVLPSALWIEIAIVGWANSSLRAMLARPGASVRTDLAFFVLSQGHVTDLLGRVMMLGASMVSGIAIRDSLARTTGFAVDPSGLPVVLQTVLYFYVYTFFDYWTHRLDHSRWFWPLHRYHHAARDFCVLTAGRAHPAAFTGTFIINLPMAILGASPSVMLYVNVLTLALGFLIHSRIDSDFGWVGRWVVQSPNHHRLHHKLDMSYATGHFGMTPVWDRLFGTFGGTPSASLAIGVDTPYRHGLWIAPDLLRDYLDFWKGWFRPSRRPLAQPPEDDEQGGLKSSSC